MATKILPIPTPASASSTPPVTQPADPVTQAAVISGPLRAKIEGEFERLRKEHAMVNPAKNPSIFFPQDRINTNRNVQQAVPPFLPNAVSSNFKLPFYYNGSVVFDGLAIACQGPRKQEQAEFWQMVWEADVKTIVMLGYPEDNTLYWPYAASTTQYPNIEHLPPLTIQRTFSKLLYQNEDTDEAITLRRFLLTKPDGTFREIDHLCVEGWPEHNYQTHAGGALSKEALVKAIQLLMGLKGRILCHCKAGVGRTGAFLATYQSHLQLTMGIKNPHLIYEVAVQGRSRDKGRTGMIHTQDQYVLIYETLFLLHPEFKDLCEQSLQNKPS